MTSLAQPQTFATSAFDRLFEDVSQLKRIASIPRGFATALNGAIVVPGTVTGTAIAADTITGNNIAANTITAGDIAANTITAGQIVAGTITTQEIAANTIVAGDIAAGTITTNEIAANTIVAGDIAAGTITATQITSGTITATQIATDTITANQIAANAITASELAANSITAGDMLANTITAGQITAGTITTTEIAANTIVAADIAAGVITATEIAASTIVAGNIAAGTITATQIATDTITATQIAANAITASELAANSITAVDMLANTVTAGQIAANTVTAGQIAATTITAGQIAAGTITATQIATGTLTGNLLAANTIAGDRLVVGTVTATEIAAGAITATELAANAVIAGKVAAGALDAYTITGGVIRSAASGQRWQGDTTGLRGFDAAGNVTFFLDAATGKVTTLAGIGGGNLLRQTAPTAASLAAPKWSTASFTIALETADQLNGFNTYKLTSTTSGSLAFYNDYTSDHVIPAAPGEEFTFSAYFKGTWAVASPNQGRATIIFYDAADVAIVGATFNGALTGDLNITAWQRSSVTATAPANTAKVRVLAYTLGAQIGDVTWMGGAQLERGALATAYSPRADEILPQAVSTTELLDNLFSSEALVDAHFAAAVLHADRIVTDSITATQIAASAITATELAANAVIAGKISAGIIVAADIATGTITATQLAANSITAADMLANTITAGQIAATTITGDRLVANTITAGQIAAGTITTTQIAANTIVAGNIAAGTITAVEVAAGAITADKITLKVGGTNLLAGLNPSFEDGTVTGYVIGTGTSALAADNTLARYGTWSAKATATASASSQVALTPSLTGVNEFEAHSASVYVRSTTASRQARILLEWRTAADAIIGSAVAGAYTPLASSGAWTRIVFEDVLPPATTARVRVYVRFAPLAGSLTLGETWNLDGLMLEEGEKASAFSLIGPNPLLSTQIGAGQITSGLISATAIDGKTITGAIIRTSAVNPRIEMTSSEIAKYDAAGLKTVRITPDNGLELLAGTATSPPSDRRVEWMHPTRAGETVTEMWSYSDGTGFGEGRLAVRAAAAGTAPRSQAFLIAATQSGGGGAWVSPFYVVGPPSTSQIEVATAGGSVMKVLLDHLGGGDYEFKDRNNLKTVTSLPGSPVDGQEVLYLADATNGVLWHLKYREAGASGKKWEFVGGPPLTVASDAGNVGVTSTSYIALSAATQLTLPALTGDYDIEVQANLLSPAGLDVCYMSYTTNVAANNPADSWAASTGFASAHYTRATQRTRHLGVPASAVVAARVKVTGGTGGYANRRLFVWPVRVG